MALISRAVTAKLICVFVFTFASCSFSDAYDFVSELCPEGTYFKNLRCIPCPAGQFKNHSSSRDPCMPCQEGRTNSATGSTDCPLCK